VRIVVCVKQVPEVSELALDPVTKRLQRDGVPLQINPFDRRAVLEATRLKIETAGTITVLSMGPPQAEAALRECLSLGVDRAVLLCDRAFAGADTLATARALARAIATIGCDLLLAGRFSIDSETGQVGPEIAALLDLPLLSGVRRLSVGAREPAAWTVAAECERDDGFAAVECATPLVVTCTDRWKTRMPLVMPDEEAAARRPLEVWTAQSLGGDVAEYGQAGSPTWVEDVQPVEVDRRRDLVVAADEMERALDAVLAEVGAVREAEARGARARVATHPARSEVRDAVWVVAELASDGRPRVVTAELLGAADQLACELGVGVAAFVVSPELAAGQRVPRDASALAALLGALGADVLLWPDDADASSELALAGSLEDALRRLAPRCVLAPATGLGRDLVPRVAARRGLGLTGDALGVELDAEGRLRQLKPAFGGQFVAPILSRTRPELATIRPGVLAPVARDTGRAPARVVRLPATAGVPRARTLAVTSELGSDGAIDAASVIVCVGHGLGKENVALAQDLAAALGGVVGATRRVCDVGWLPRQLQIGISGRSVAPELYLALGVRGSFNHTVGIRRARRVIAVNRDAAADVFAVADLGIVGDAPGFAAALLARLRTDA